MAELVETIEDLQLRALPRVRVFDAQQNLQTPAASTNRVACSSRFGICVLADGSNKLYSCTCAEIHKLGLQQQGLSAEETSAVPFRQIQHHNPQSQIASIAVNADGSTLALALNTPNGPFVEMYDVVAFAPTAQQQPFPLASIRLSSNTNQQPPGTSLVQQIEWNPIEPDVFAALTSDHTLCTIKCSLEMGSSFAILGLLDTNISATCVCWSPKGKQLTVGDSLGRIHQLKPDLSPVRTIEAPDKIPIFGMESRFCCTGVFWLSTTEWLVSHCPAAATSMSISSPSPCNIALLVVKKQQPPKWTHHGDVLRTAKGSVSFCPMLDWHMVIVYSSDCASVVLFGLRGEHWVRFEFEAYDIEMPLTADKRSQTFPLGARLDLSSTSQIHLGDGADRTTRGPQPFIHFLNSSGCLLPYAIVSLTSTNNTMRPELTKEPGPVPIANARFGKPPPGYIQPIQPQQPMTPPQPQQQPQAVQAAGAGADQMINFAPKPQQQQQLVVTPPALQGQGQQQASPIDVVAESEKAAAYAQQQQQQKEQAEKEEKRKRALLLEEQRARVQALETQLGNSVTEYTRQRNAQAHQIDALRMLRVEVEKRASALNTEQFGELHNIKRDLQQSVRQAVAQVAKTRAGIQQNVEALNGLKLFHREQQRGRGGGAVQQPQQRSFDMEKRLQLVEDQFESVLDKFEGTKRMLNNLDEQRQFLMASCNEAIDPLEQRRIIQVNDNIAKLCVKLDARLQRMRRSVEEGRTSTTTTKPIKFKQYQQDNRGQNLSSMTQFCAMELDQLTLSDSSSNKDHWVLLDAADQQSQTSTTQQWQRNLYKFLTNLPGEEVPIRSICPLKTAPSPAAADAGTARKLGHRVANDDYADDLRLAQRLQQATCTPPKPQLCSVGVQSPDFMMATPTTKSGKDKTPKKTSSKKVVPTTATATTTVTSAVVTPTPTTSLFAKMAPTKPAEQQQQNVAPLGAVAMQPPATTFAATTTMLPSLAPSATTITPPPAPVVSAAVADGTTKKLVVAPETAEVLPSVVQPPPQQPVVTTTAPTTTTVAATSIVTLPQPVTTTVPETTTTTMMAPAVVEEGMEDEVSNGTAAATTTPVTFDFMKSGGGLGGLGSSTPINAGRNPFGGPIQAQQSGGVSGSSGGSTLFGTPASSFGTGTPFGTPTAKPSGTGFGALGVSPIAANASSSSSSAFGASPFSANRAPSAFGGGGAFGSAAAAAPGSGSTFGGGATFGGGTSPFAKAASGGGGFGASPFGGGATGTMGGKSMFGGGMQAAAGAGAAPVGSGFSAFAAKSSGFGQLAQQQQGPTSSSLFGGGPATAGAGGGFSSFGASPSAMGTSPTSSMQAKPSAFTTFRK